MKILVIAPEQLPVPPIKGGSIETCVYNIFRRMAHIDRVTILSRTYRQLPYVSKLVDDKSRIIRVGKYSRLAYIKAVLRKIRGNHFDVIQIENRPTFVPFVRRVFPRTPIVLSLHSLTFMSQLSKRRANQILHQVNGVTSVSQFVTHTMKKRYPNYSSKFRTARNGVDTNKFRPRSISFKQTVRRKWKVSGSYNIIFIGRIVKGKGLHTLVRAVSILKKRYPRISLVAVGSSWPGDQSQTAYMRKVRSLSKRLRVPIRFTGYLPPAKVSNAYHLGDVFVCPSLYQEGLTLVCLEAMASGIPVVGSNRGGIREAVAHGKSGLLVSDYKNPKAFARAIHKILSTPALARRLKEGGRQRMKARFSWYSTVRSLKRHYLTISSSS